jgi:very-short-patch-repair endonuclease
MKLRARQRKVLAPFEERYAAGDARRLAPTRAEAALENLLNELGNGALRGEFRREWPFEGWFLDFYFPHIRLAIEVDGGYHRAQAQWREDQWKTRALEAQGITVLRLTNVQVLGDRAALVQMLRMAWREALRRGADGAPKHEAREQGAAYLAREPSAVYAAGGRDATMPGAVQRGRLAPGQAEPGEPAAGDAAMQVAAAATTAGAADTTTAATLNAATNAPVNGPMNVPTNVVAASDEAAWDESMWAASLH